MVTIAEPPMLPDELSRAIEAVSLPPSVIPARLMPPVPEEVLIEIDVALARVGITVTAVDEIKANELLLLAAVTKSGTAPLPGL